ncbi:MAG: hypothetical protein QOI10_2867 [Solirubrobacterales bacterium]|nr:hypothetical protein [Solirubrobacterales bacterium]
MRRTTMAGALSIVVLVALASLAFAKGVALEGKFKVTATVGANDFGIDPGTKTKNTYKFKCANDACTQVKLTRVDAGGTYKSTLKLSGSTYSGTEGPYPYPSCPDNGAATFTVDHKVKISDDDGDEATKISGTAATKIHDCDFASFVDYKVKGKLK